MLSLNVLHLKPSNNVPEKNPTSISADVKMKFNRIHTTLTMIIMRGKFFLSVRLIATALILSVFR